MKYLQVVAILSLTFAFALTLALLTVHFASAWFDYVIEWPDEIVFATVIAWCLFAASTLARLVPWSKYWE